MPLILSLFPLKIYNSCTTSTMSITISVNTVASERKEKNGVQMFFQCNKSRQNFNHFKFLLDLLGIFSKVLKLKSNMEWV